MPRRVVHPAPIPEAPKSETRIILPDRITSHDELTPDIVQAVTTQLLATASKAREDVATFFEFVMKDFTGKRPFIQLAPHQRVGLDFMMHHERSVNMWPVGSSKTWLALGLTLYFLGRDPELRGAVVSATEEQAKKIVGLARGYIETSMELHLVFPHLRRSTKEGDAWTQTAITVERRRGIKDASLSAFGIDSPRVIGSRLNWVVIDDVLNDVNTNTKDLRDALVKNLDTYILSRIDSQGWSKCVIINTPWHPDDAIHHARDHRGWACMRMDLLGDLEVWDDASCFEKFLGTNVPNPKYGKTWDSELLRPADPNDQTSRLCRLVAHDPDPKNEQLLWPEVCDWKYIEDKRREAGLPVFFNQLYRCIARDDATSMCKVEYIDKCLKVARDLRILSMVSEYKGPNLTFTGIDLAISEGEEHDETAFFTFEARPGGLNVILDIEIGQWDGPTILDKTFQKCTAYNSIIRVENNAAQDYIRQFALRRDLSLPIKGHTTEKFAKANPTTGIPGLFVELSNGAWAIPNNMRGEKHPMVKKFIDACLYYTPKRHTFDVLMAAYFAREQKREFVGLTGDPGQVGENSSPGQTIMQR